MVSINVKGQSIVYSHRNSSSPSLLLILPLPSSHPPPPFFSSSPSPPITVDSCADDELFNPFITVNAKTQTRHSSLGYWIIGRNCHSDFE